MIYLCYGVPKSASTFTYVVTEHILRVAGYAPFRLSAAAKGLDKTLNYIDPISWEAIERVASEIGERSAVIKTHGAPDGRMLEEIGRGNVFGSAVIRDPRDVALSLLDHARRSRIRGDRDFAEIHSLHDTLPLLDEQITRFSQWMRSDGILLIGYNEICFDTAAAAGRIINQLGIGVTQAEVISTLPDRRKIEQFNKGWQKRYATEMRAATQQIFLERYGDLYRRYNGIL